jgi:glutamine---fructose-6-phosphate transaminase (isomerizing)
MKPPTPPGPSTAILDIAQGCQSGDMLAGIGSALHTTIDAQAGQLERMLGVDVVEAAAALSGTQRIWLIGTGSSQHAAELGAWMLDSGGRERHWSSSATFARFGPRLGPDDGVVIITHTGETAFAIRCRAQALAAGARVVSIIGEGGADWPEAIETVPREDSETYTASYTAALVVLARLAAALGAGEIREDELEALPGRVRAAATAPVSLEAIPPRLVVIAGVGPGAVTAREGAVKLREAARLPAEGYEGEYLLHGSAVPLGASDSLVLLAPSGDPDGLLSAIGSAAEGAGVSVAVIEEPDGLSPVLAQIPLTVRLQVLACSWADRRGQDPDTVITGSWAEPRLWRIGGASPGTV